MIEVIVRQDNDEKKYELNFKKAMSQFKKKVANSKVLIETRERRYYKKPSEKKKLKSINARKQKRD